MSTIEPIPTGVHIRIFLLSDDSSFLIQEITEFVGVHKNTVLGACKALRQQCLTYQMIDGIEIGGVGKNILVDNVKVRVTLY